MPRAINRSDATVCFCCANNKKVLVCANWALLAKPWHLVPARSHRGRENKVVVWTSKRKLNCCPLCGFVQADQDFVKNFGGVKILPTSHGVIWPDHLLSGASPRLLHPVSSTPSPPPHLLHPISSTPSPSPRLLHPVSSTPSLIVNPHESRAHAALSPFSFWSHDRESLLKSTLLGPLICQQIFRLPFFRAQTK